MTLKPKGGDILHVRMRAINCVYDGGNYMTAIPVSSVGPSTTIAVTDIVHIEPRALQPGDRMRTKTGGIVTIIAAEAGNAFVRYDDGSVNLIREASLEVISDE